MSVKHLIKSAFMLVKKKRLIPILQSSDPDKLLSDKVALLIGGTGGIGGQLPEHWSKVDAG